MITLLSAKNPQNLILYFATFISFSACASIALNIDSISTSPPNKTLLRENLYRDSSGTIYLKVKNRRIMHPSQWDKHFEDSIFFSRVFLDTGYIELSKVIDCTTFKKVNTFTSYWEDSLHIYVLRPLPITSPQFFILHRGKEKYYGTRKDFLLYDTTLYFHGDVVRNVNIHNLSIIKYPRENGRGYIEFLSDGTSLFSSTYKLDKERLKFIDDLSEETKKEIIERFKLE